MRGVFFWEAGGLVLDKANPYGGLLAQAMREVGVELEAGYPDTLTEEWLCQNQGRIDLLHLNWPNYMYDDPDLNDRLARCTELISNLALARLLGYRIVWTVHNLYPHESISRDLDRFSAGCPHPPGQRGNRATASERASLYARISTARRASLSFRTATSSSRIPTISAARMLASGWV